MLFTIISIAILIMSVVVHEVSHGFMADKLGDPTPRLQGRLTLNPLKHLDPVGSFIVPIVTSLAGFTFGWAKPVVYNPYNLKNKKRGEFLIALAGPVSNTVVAIIFGTVVRFAAIGATTLTPFIEITSTIVVINIILAVFNLIPIPPLDGSKLLFAFLPIQYQRFRMKMEMYAPIFVVLLVFFLWQFISPIIPVIFNILTGVRTIAV